MYQWEERKVSSRDKGPHADQLRQIRLREHKVWAKYPASWVSFRPETMVPIIEIVLRTTWDGWSRPHDTGRRRTTRYQKFPSTTSSDVQLGQVSSLFLRPLGNRLIRGLHQQTAMRHQHILTTVGKKKRPSSCSRDIPAADFEHAPVSHLGHRSCNCN
jgi:hypothetical protein